MHMHELLNLGQIVFIELTSLSSSPSSIADLLLTMLTSGESVSSEDDITVHKKERTEQLNKTE